MISILGMNIKNIRESKGISGYKLSKISGVGASTLSQIETGKRQSLNSSTIEKIASALEVSVDDLMATEDNQEVEVNDLEQILYFVLSSDDVSIDDKILTKCEKEQLKLAFNNAIEMIRLQRGE